MTSAKSGCGKSDQIWHNFATLDQQQIGLKYCFFCIVPEA